MSEKRVRPCREVGCTLSAMTRKFHCAEHFKTHNDKNPSSNPDTRGSRLCTICNAERDIEDFIVSVDRGQDRHYRTRYGRECDDCRFQRDWADGVGAPAIDGLVPYERAKREVAYAYRQLPSRWINSSGMLARLHTLLMFKYGAVRDEQIDLRIDECRRDIAEFGA